MKKITFFLAAFLMASMGFSQSILQSSISAKAQIDEEALTMPNYEKTKRTTANFRAPGDISYMEPFDTTAAYPPTGWDTVSIIGPNWQHGTNGNPDGDAMISYTQFPEANRQVILVSPVWTVPASNPRLLFDWSTSYYWLVGNNTDNVRVMISTDGGTTWTDTLWKEDDQALVAAGGNPWPYDNFEWYSASIDISAYAGQNVTFGFYYHTNVGVGGHDGVSFYLDNVGIMEEWADNLIMENSNIDFENPGWYSQIPVYQPIGLVNDSITVYNKGLNTQTNVHFDVSIKHGGTNDFSQTMTTSGTGLTDFASHVRDGYLMNVGFMPDSTNFYTYTLTNTIDQDQLDQDTTDNMGSWSFTMTCNYMARYNNMTRTLSVEDYGGGNNDELGVIMYIPNPDTVASMSFYCSTSTTVGTSCKAILYSLDPVTGDWVSVIESDIHDFTAQDLGQVVTIPFIVDGFSEIIPGGGLYLVDLQFYFDPATEDIRVGADDELPISEVGYQNTVNLHLTGTWYYITSGVPTYVLNFIDHHCFSGAETQTTQMNVQIYPNPANTQLHVDNVEGATVSVYNLVGEKVFELANANKFNTLNTDNLAAGTYIVKVVNNNQVKTSKINIVK